MAYLPLVRIIFKLSGLWGKNEDMGRIHLFLVQLSFGIVVYYWFGLTYHLYSSMKDNESPFSEKSNAFFIFTAYTVVLSNYIVLYVHGEETKDFFEDLENFETFGYPKNLNKVTRILDLFCFCTDCYCGIGCKAFALLGYMQYDNCLEKTLIRNRTSTCGFSFKVTYPYDISNGALLYTHLCLEVAVAVIFVFGSHLMICSIAVVEMINIRLNHLADLLSEVTNNGNEENKWMKLRKCIIYHIHIIKLTERANDTYQIGTTIMILSYGVTVGAILIVVSEEYDLISIFSLIGYTVIVFMLCFSGQRLHDKSIYIGEVAYGLEWFNSYTNIGRNVQFIILRSNKPLTYSCAWGVGDFFMETFQKVMSAAYKFTSLKTSVGK